MEENKLNITDFYQEFDPNLINFIKGHLFIENAMEKILNNIPMDKGVSDKFAGKVSQMLMYNVIDEDMANLIRKINKIRNNIAHDLFYKLTFDEVFDLVEESAKLGVDYSDDSILDKESAKEYYGLEGLIGELFPNLYMDLFYCNEHLFGDEEFNNFLG